MPIEIEYKQASPPVESAKLMCRQIRCQSIKADTWNTLAPGVRLVVARGEDPGTVIFVDPQDARNFAQALINLADQQEKA